MCIRYVEGDYNSAFTHTHTVQHMCKNYSHRQRQSKKIKGKKLNLNNVCKVSLERNKYSNKSCQIILQR